MLTKEQIGKAWREAGTLSSTPPDWAIDFAQRCARAARDGAIGEAAKVCEEMRDGLYRGTSFYADAAGQCADAIRALREGS